jgi:hypothetical protein
LRDFALNTRASAGTLHVQQSHNQAVWISYQMSAGKNEDEGDDDTSTKVAYGYLGDLIFWEGGFEALGEVQSILSHLEEEGEKNVDWKSLIGEHSYFAVIKEANFPPLYDETDFETWFDDLFAVVTEPTGDKMPDQSFNFLDLYVAKNEKEKVIRKFTDFLQHLKSLKPLRDAGIV